MADLQLNRPQAQQQEVLHDVADARLVLNFSPSDASVERDGDNLVFRFDDGGSLVLDNFYSAYTSEQLPDFQIDGAEIAGSDFFAALDADLMPAAGPAAGADQAARNAAYRTWGTSDLMGGIDRLGGLDLGFNGASRQEETLDGLGGRNGLNGAERLNRAPLVFDQYGHVMEDNPDAASADGWALTGAVRGDGVHAFSWNSGNQARYGTFLQQPDGTFTYVLNNDHPEVQALGQGETRTESFEFTYTDQDGDAAKAHVIITITGTNDVPVIQAGSDALGLKEAGVGGAHPNDPLAGVWHVQDSFLVSDVDVNDTQAVSITDGAGRPLPVAVDPVTGALTVVTAYGVFTLAPQPQADGSVLYTYAYALDNAAADPLNQGQSVNYNFRVTVADSAGATVTQPVNIHIDGTNDRPALTLSHPDVILGEDSRFAGSFTVADHDADGAFNASTGGLANQRYSIAGLLDGEGNPVTGTPADSPDTGGSASFATAYGTLTVNPDGTYTFVPSDKAQTLGQGESRTESFEVTVTDLHGATDARTVTITLTGANDAPVITGQGEGLLLVESGVGSRADYPDGGWAEGVNQTRVPGVLTAESSFTVSDVDATDTLSAAIVDADGNPLPGAGVDPATGVMTLITVYGVLTVTPNANPDGSITYTYRYDLDDAAVNGLNRGDVLDQRFGVRVTDQAGASVTHPVDVRIEGTNDAPRIVFGKVHVKETGVAPGGNEATTGDGADNNFVFPDRHRVEVEGQLQASDPDSASQLTFGINVHAADGGVNLGGISVGLYTGSGSSARPVTGGDGQPLTETLQILRSATSVDPVTGHAIQTVETNYGVLTLDTVTGHFHFALNDTAAHHLAQGEKFDFHFTTTVTDEHGAQGHHMLGVTVEGTNDVPVLVVDKPVLDVFEQGAGDDAHHSPTVQGTAFGDDVDQGAMLRYSFGLDAAGRPITEITDAYGTIRIDPVTGVYTYTLDNDSPVVQAMHSGDTVTQNRVVVVTDEHGATAEVGIAVNIHGADDAPTIGAIPQLVLKEDGVYDHGNVAHPGTLAGGGVIRVNDVDEGDNAAGFTFSVAGRNGNPQDADAPAGWQAVRVDTGTLYLNTATGEYRFEVDNSPGGLVDRMNNTQQHTRTFTVTVTDQNGVSAARDFTVKVQGTNDRPEISVHTPELTVTEDAALTATGSVGNVLDIDSSDVHTFGIVGTGMNDTPQDSTPAMHTVLEGRYGYLTINPLTGEYTYHLNNSLAEVQGLRAGDSLEEVFHIGVTDKAGAFDIRDVTVTVRGTDDFPIIQAGVQVHNVVEAGVAPGGNTPVDGIPVVSGQIVARDPDVDGETGQNQALKYSFGTDGEGRPILSVATAYGTMVIDPDTGVYTYTLHNAADAVNGLQAGEKRQDGFTVQVTDPEGNSVTQNVIVNIQGTNDRPVIDAPPVLNAYEDDEHGPVYGGQVTARDLDLPESGQLRYSAVNGEGKDVQTVSGKYGYLTINQSTGAYEYHLYNELDAVQGLGEGDSLNDESFVVRVTDNLGASGETTINVVIHGQDDAPGITGGLNVGVTEDNGQEGLAPTLPGTSGQVLVHDPDSGDTDRAFYFVDGDGNRTQTLTGQWGSIAIDPDTGRYTYVLTENADLQHLNADTGAADRFTVHVSTGRDGNVASSVTGTITVAITGANDNPVIVEPDSDLSISLNAGGVAQNSATGSLAATDVDDIRWTFHLTDGEGNQLQTATGLYGALTLAPDGSYTYTLNKYSDAFRGIPTGEERVERFFVDVYDEHGGVTSQEVLVTIYGVDQGQGPDDPVVDPRDLHWSVDLSLREDEFGPRGEVSKTGGLVDEDGNPLAPGATAGLVFSFRDAAGQLVQTVRTPYGSVSIDPDSGEVTYTLDNSSSTVQSLGDGDAIAHGPLPVWVNGRESGITVNVATSGDNDAPDITGQDNLRVAEGGPLTADGQIVAEDVDHDANLRYWLVDEGGNRVDSLSTAYGTITLDPATGAYTYAMHPGLPHQNAEWTHNEHFTVVVDDGSGASNATDTTSVTVTLHGSNHPPTLTVAHLEVTEDGTTLAGHLPLVSDDMQEGFRYSLTDSAGANGATLVVGRYGSLIIDPATGAYTYRLDNNHAEVQGLGAGESAAEIFYVTVTDKQGATDTRAVEVTIHGSNDEPRLFVGPALITAEGAPEAVTGSATALDADARDSLQFGFGFQLNPDGTLATDGQGRHIPVTEVVTDYGTFRIDPATGAYSFTVNNDSAAVRGLGAGDVHRESVAVMVADSAGATDSRELTVHITGANSAPEFVVPPTGEVTEDAALAFTGMVRAQDPDAVSELRYFFTLPDGSAAQRVQTAHGVLTMDPRSGEYTYTLNNSHPDVQGLGLGESMTDSVTVTVTDEYGATTSTELAVTIHGSNDAPVITSRPPILGVAEDTRPTATGVITVTDVDVNDTHLFSVRLNGEDGGGSEAVGRYGILTIDGTGRYTYTLTSRELGAGESATETFTVTVDDQHGGTATQTITINIVGVNDMPVITSATANPETNTGSFAFTDADVNDTHTFAVVVGGVVHALVDGTADIDGLGRFSLTQGPDGWNYAFTASAAAQAALMAGTTVEHEFRFQIGDGHADVRTDVLAVSVTGTNTEPVITGSAMHDLSLGILTPYGEVAYTGHVDGLPVQDDQPGALHFAFTGASDHGDVAGVFGTLHFDADSGEYTYALNTSEDGLNRLAQAIAHGDSLTDRFEYAVHDGVWGEAHGSLDVNLTDPPRAGVGTDGADSLGDPAASGAQLLFGQEGDDRLYGGSGDDLLFGGQGDDYLDGGSGSNRLYGGEGSDILVYSPDNAAMDGGSGIDFLLGVDRAALDTLLNPAHPDNSVSNVEVFVTQSPGSLNLTSMGDMAALGISVDGDRLSLSEAWQPAQPGPGDAGLPDGFAEYTLAGAHGGEDMSIVVQKSMLENHNG